MGEKQIQRSPGNCAAAVTAANLKGRTFLPLPTSLQSSGRIEGKAKWEEKHPGDMQILEAAVLMWTRQIRAALKPPPFESLEVARLHFIFSVYLVSLPL